MSRRTKLVVGLMIIGAALAITLLVPSVGSSLALECKNANVPTGTTALGYQGCSTNFHDVNETFELQVDVTNYGDANGTLSLALSVNGTAVDHETVTVERQRTQVAKLRHNFTEMGTYNVSLNGLEPWLFEVDLDG